MGKCYTIFPLLDHANGRLVVSGMYVQKREQLRESVLTYIVKTACCCHHDVTYVVCVLALYIRFRFLSPRRKQTTAVDVGVVALILCWDTIDSRVRLYFPWGDFVDGRSGLVKMDVDLCVPGAKDVVIVAAE